jgi:hypothetical protein
MKAKALIITCVLVSLFSIAKSQITLEHTYDSSKVNLYMVDLEEAGMKYIKVKRYGFNEVQNLSQIDRRVKLYNLDHTLWKDINLNFVPVTYSVMYNSSTWEYDTSYTSNFDVLYVSQKLFNQDNKVEMLISYSPGETYAYSTMIINEDGQILFSEDNFAPFVRVNIPQSFRPIYNTPQGTKMILTYSGDQTWNKESRVYSLAGTLSDKTDQSPVDPIDNNPTISLSVTPNPTNDVAKISYTLPGSETAGTLDVYSSAGQLVRKIQINGNSNYINLNKADFATGMYIVRLTCNGANLSEKMLLVN